MVQLFKGIPTWLETPRQFERLDSWLALGVCCSKASTELMIALRAKRSLAGQVVDLPGNLSE